MVNQAKKSRSFVCNQNRNTSQKQYKCIKSECHKFSTGPCNSEKPKNLKKFLKIALGELFLKIYILPGSDKYLGPTETNLVSQLSDLVLGV